MRKLVENQLICMLSRNELRAELSDDELRVLFDDFTIALTQMRDAENSNEEIFRTLNYTKAFCALKISPNEVKKKCANY